MPTWVSWQLKHLPLLEKNGCSRSFITTHVQGPANPGVYPSSREDKTPIPLLSDLPVKSKGQWDNNSLKDLSPEWSPEVRHLRGLVITDKTFHPGKLKLWYLQIRSIPRLMWPLTVYKIPKNKVKKLERTMSAYINKWLGLPLCSWPFEIRCRSFAAPSTTKLLKGMGLQKQDQCLRQQRDKQ